MEIFNTIVQLFDSVASNGISTIRSLSMATFWLLATIEVALAFIMNVIDEGNPFKVAIEKTLKIGFWLFMINEWGTLCNAVLESFIQIGVAIGGSSAEYLANPSSIVDAGIKSLLPIFNYLGTFHGPFVLANLQVILAGIMSYAIGCVAYIILGAQVTITYIEFYLVCAMFTAFVPFGVSKWTSFLAEKAIGGVIAYGVKFMAMSCLLGIIAPVINSIANTEMNAFNALFIMISTAGTALLMCFLAWQVPALAASVMTGGPALSVGSVAGAALGAGVAGAAALVGGAKALGAVASGFGGGNDGGNKGGSSGGGNNGGGGYGSSLSAGGGSSSSSDSSSSNNTSPKFSSGGANYSGGSGESTGGSSSSSGSGGSTGGSSSSGGSGGSTGGGSSSSGSGGSTGGGSSSSGSSGNSGGSSSSGDSDGNTGGGSSSGGSGGSSGGDSSSSGSGGNTGGGSSDKGKEKKSKMPSFSDVVQTGNMLRGAMPQEASPQGNIHAPIKD